MRVDLKGVKRIKAKGRTYYYAWRGGPRLSGEPGSPEFIASYQAAHESRRPSDDGRFRALVTLYRASPEYTRLADSTRRQWAPWLDRISDHFGPLRLKAFESPSIRPVIRRWRDQWADKPRTADYGMQVLSRVLAYAIDPLDRLTKNPCKDMPGLYRANRAAVIWTEADLKALKATCPAEVAHAVDLAAATGLRRGDLLRLSWSHIGPDRIEIATGKSNSRRVAVVPLYDELRAVLDRIPKRSPVILTNSHRQPWTADGFGTAFNRAKRDAGMAGRDLHFHDLRGTAATRFHAAGLEDRDIAEMMGWAESTVARIIRVYVARGARTEAMIATLNKTERRT